MGYQVVVSDNYQNGFAKTRINRGGIFLSEIKVNTVYLRNRICNFLPLAEDFFLIGSTVYSLDKLVSRNETTDNWTRKIQVTIPVSEPQLWAGVAKQLAHCVGFLTGDRWIFTFVARSNSLFVQQTPKRNQSVTDINANAVCLFSGGLDSLVGAIDWLEEHKAE